MILSMVGQREEGSRNAAMVPFAAGAFGYFEVTHDISKYCKAKIFSQIGKRTPLAVRFSTVGE